MSADDKIQRNVMFLLENVALFIIQYEPKSFIPFAAF